MKTIFTFLAICLSGISVNASHLLGGYITAKTLSGRLFEITVVTLTDRTSPANEGANNITISFGDGVSGEVARTSELQEPNAINRNTYTTTHLYSSDGVFKISYTDPNLIPNIINVNFGISDMSSFYIEAVIRINSSLGTNQTAVPLAYEKVNTTINQPLHYNPTFAGAGNETIEYELETQTYLPNYVLPAGTQINPYSGMFSFTPDLSGYYLFFIKASSFKNGILVSSTTAAQLVSVKDAVFTLPVVEVADADLYSQGWYRRALDVNEVMSQPFTFISPNAVTASVHSELFSLDATDSIVHPTNDQTTILMNWTALQNYSRNTPYFATYRLRSANNFIYDYNIAFYLGAPLNTATTELTPETQSAFAYPNPITNGQFTLVLPESIIDAQLVVYDALGKMVLSDKVNGNTYHHETTLWKSGMYSYTLQTRDGKYMNGKVIVK